MLLYWNPKDREPNASGDDTSTKDGFCSRLFLFVSPLAKHLCYNEIKA